MNKALLLKCQINFIFLLWFIVYSYYEYINYVIKYDQDKLFLSVTKIHIT